MRRSTACSSIALFFVTLLAFGSPAFASSQSGEAEPPSTSSLRIYGAYLPDRLQWDDARWGFGFATRTTLDPRWGIDVGAARFAGPDRSITPMTVGIAYGPVSRGGLRPWLGVGVGYYRLESSSAVARVIPTLAYYEPEGSRPKYHRNNVGGYFGLGLDVPLTGRLGLGTGLRIHGWSGPDALIALQSGLNFGL